MIFEEEHGLLFTAKTDIHADGTTDKNCIKISRSYLGSEQHEVVSDVDDASRDDAQRETGEDVGVVALARLQHRSTLRVIVREGRARRKHRTLLPLSFHLNLICIFK